MTQLPQTPQPSTSPLDENASAPLTLTVHSLPDATAGARASGEAAGTDPAATRRGRIAMLLVTLVCAAPVIASYFAFYFVRPDTRRNYGELVAQSAIPPSLMVRTQSGTQQAFSSLKDQWLLVSVADAACDAACEKHLYLQRQLRESLGREKARIDWVWLVTDDAPIAAKLLPALQDARVLRVDPGALARWLKPADGNPLAAHLYVVDPMGNWMLRFPADLDPGKAKKDLERLLRASVHWDKAGRSDVKAAMP